MHIVRPRAINDRPYKCYRSFFCILQQTLLLVVMVVMVAAGCRMGYMAGKVLTFFAHTL